MNLRLERNPAWETAESVMGRLYVNDEFECYTIERPRCHNGQLNVPFFTCILEGIYDIIMHFSLHFNRLIPILQNVPCRTNVEIHNANRASELRGCIAVGGMRTTDFVGNSRITLDHLIVKIQSAIKLKEVIQIEIMTIGKEK